MGRKMRFPESPSGAEFTGDGPTAGTAGSTVVPGWDASTREWGPVTLPAGGGGSFTNLSNVCFVDGFTIVPAPDQTGNIEAPFSDFAAARLAFGNAVYYVTGGTNYGDLSVAADEIVEIIGWGASLAAFGAIDVAGGGLLILRGFLQTGEITGEADALIQAYLSGGNGITATTGIASIAGAAIVTLVGPADLGGVGGGNAMPPTCGNIACGSAYLKGWATGDIAASGENEVLEIRNTSCGSVSVPNGTAIIDLATLAYMRLSGFTITTDTPVRVSDAPCAIDQVVLAGTNVIQRLTVVLPDAHPGDTFAVATTNGASPLPVNAMLGSAFCEVSGQVIVPIFLIDVTTVTVEVVVTRFTVGDTLA